MPDAVKRKRPRRRKRRLSLSSSSSSSGSDSSSEGEAGVTQPLTNGHPISADDDEAESSSSEESSSSSSSSSSSDSDSDTPGKASTGAAAIALAESSKAASVASASSRPEPVNRKRSPSPPYFGYPDYVSPFSTTRRTKPLLWGELPADKESEVKKSEREQKWAKEQEELTKHYLEITVNRFGKELDAMKQEPGVSDRLGLLVKSLSQGASLMETTNLAEDLASTSSIWTKAASSTAKAGDIALEALHKKNPASASAADHEDTEMA